MKGRARPDGRMKQKAWTAGFRKAGEVWREVLSLPEGQTIWKAAGASG